jgi:hypothetical protein
VLLDGKVITLIQNDFADLMTSIEFNVMSSTYLFVTDGTG